MLRVQNNKKNPKSFPGVCVGEWKSPENEVVKVIA